jgi:hypothetical protein
VYGAFEEDEMAKLDLGAFEDSSRMIKSIHDEFVLRMNLAHIPIISGSIFGNGLALIHINAESDFSQVMELISAGAGSIAVVDIQKSTRKGFEQFLSEFNGYVRQGTTSTWFHRGVNNGALEESRDYDDEYAEDADEFGPERPSEEVSKVLSSVALSVARMDGFGRRKNRAQRQEMAMAMLGTPDYSEVSSVYLGEVTQRAESLFEHAVLPQQVTAMAAQGKSVSDIAKALGLSKPRIERALSAPMPEHTADIAVEDKAAGRKKSNPDPSATSFLFG